ncbi:hypothetical protein DD777_03995 [Helicobacter pylori]|nr:hypothetical protein DD777_03995 [Helicobacter pylori]
MTYASSFPLTKSSKTLKKDFASNPPPKNKNLKSGLKNQKKEKDQNPPKKRKFKKKSSKKKKERI